jgi:deoxyhypusine synthase
MREVEQIKPGKDLTRTLASFRQAAHGAEKLGKAVEICKNMKGERILAISGALVPSGLRNVIINTVERGFATILISNGANLVHDIIEALGGKHYVLEKGMSDKELHKKGLNRIGSVLVKTTAFQKFEDFMQSFFERVYKTKKIFSVQEITELLGKELRTKKSLLSICYKKGVPVYCPAIVDSILGLQLFFFNQRMKGAGKERLVLDITADMDGLNNRMLDAKQVGAMILGGGVTKHFAMGCTLLRGGLDSAVQITMDREETGSLSGAKLEEGISWGKLKENSNHVTVIGDAIMLFPILVSGIS